MPFPPGARFSLLKRPTRTLPEVSLRLIRKSKIVFTSDLFGSYGSDWELFLELKPECIECKNLAYCPQETAELSDQGYIEFPQKDYDVPQGPQICV